MNCAGSRWRGASAQAKGSVCRSMCATRPLRSVPAALQTRKHPCSSVAYSCHAPRGSPLAPRASNAGEGCRELPDTRRPVVTGQYDLSTVLSLSNIRQTLIRLGDTMLFALLERAQFARNAAVYEPNGIAVPAFGPRGERYTLLQFYMHEMEQIQGRIRRYTSPDEQAFFPSSLPPLILPPLTYQTVLAPCADAINANSRIMDIYLQELLPDFTRPGDDGNYGSAVMYDVAFLQVVSRRVHYGKFVAEAKFREDTQLFTRLIRTQDREGLMLAITDAKVEAKNIERVRLRAAMFGQDIDDALAAAEAAKKGSSSKRGDAGAPTVDPDFVARLYQQWIMPLTKDVEVEYLLHRLD